MVGGRGSTRQLAGQAELALFVGLFGFAAAGSGCSVLLDADPVQCEVSEDCDFLDDEEGEYACQASACTPVVTAVCPPVTAYTLTQAAIVVPNACDLAAGTAPSVLTAGENEAEVALPGELPFDVCLYGNRATTLWIGDNGYVSAGDAPPGVTQPLIGLPHSLGVAGVPGPGVAAFWDTLQVGAQGVCSAVAGESPNRTLWLTWAGACFEDGTGACGADPQSSLTFSVGFEESTGNVIVGYVAVTADAELAERANGLMATIGITNGGARGCAATECSAAGLCADASPCGYTEFSSNTAVAILPTLQFAATL